ncbi:hypothetical protein ILUMI_08143 [Ignelater luminosus]|uniref:Uncharacterized protein n=1 Tax=Ignelater luminosus TaxID=2038154 RepID=A0A8K0D6U7_IGNLU|nr:hypothetical protein ILUMI_08143 [Ignelater luminosus]
MTTLPWTVMIVILYKSFLWTKVIALPFYHQKDYDVKPERLEMLWYDHSVARDVKYHFGWHNRSYRAFNGSFYSLIEHPTTDLVGYYYIRDFMPDFSLLPPYIPRGQYKVAGKLFYNKKLVGEGNAYGEVLDKPLKWE